MLVLVFASDWESKHQRNTDKGGFIDGEMEKNNGSWKSQLEFGS